jgi:hypothetical protein
VLDGSGFQSLLQLAGQILVIHRRNVVEARTIPKLTQSNIKFNFLLVQVRSNAGVAARYVGVILDQEEITRLIALINDGPDMRASDDVAALSSNDADAH